MRKVIFIIFICLLFPCNIFAQLIDFLEYKAKLTTSFNGINSIEKSPFNVSIYGIDNNEEVLRRGRHVLDKDNHIIINFGLGGLYMFNTPPRQSAFNIMFTETIEYMFNNTYGAGIYLSSLNNNLDIISATFKVFLSDNDFKPYVGSDFGIAKTSAKDPIFAYIPKLGAYYIYEHYLVGADVSCYLFLPFVSLNANVRLGYVF